MEAHGQNPPVRCFTRKENNGIRVLFPLEGPLKQNCLIVNETVQFAYQGLVEGLDLQGLLAAFVARAEAEFGAELEKWERAQAEAAARPESNGSGNGGAAPARSREERPRPPTLEQVRFDLYRILVMLKDHDICRYRDEDLLTLVPQGKEVPGVTQLMPVKSIAKTAEFFQASLDPGSGVVPFYTLPRTERLVPEYFAAAGVARRHLSQQQVYFVHVDKGGRIEAASLLAGFGAQPASLRLGYVAARCESRDAYEDAVGRHVAMLCGLLSVTALSPMVRLQVPTGNDADVTLHESFYEVIGELGFRRSFDLPDELGKEAGLVGYDKVLF